MRTTLTLDDDVAAMLERARKKSSVGFKELVNDLLRQGLKQAMSIKPPSKPYRTPVSHGGECLVGSIANIEEVLDLIEGPLRR